LQTPKLEVAYTASLSRSTAHRKQILQLLRLDDHHEPVPYNIMYIFN
jgi:hypothetical protein